MVTTTCFFRLWAVTNVAIASHSLFTPSLSVGLIHIFHSILTLPLSHHKYNEWLYKVEIGIWCLKWWAHPDFWVTSGDKCGWIQTKFSHQAWVCLDWFTYFTASWPFHRLILSIMNGYTRFRLEFDVKNGEHMLISESHEGQSLDPHQLFTPSLSVFGFLCLIISKTNGYTRLLLEFGF